MREWGIRLFLVVGAAGLIYWGGRILGHGDFPLGFKVVYGLVIGVLLFDIVLAVRNRESVWDRGFRSLRKLWSLLRRSR